MRKTIMLIATSIATIILASCGSGSENLEKGTEITSTKEEVTNLMKDKSKFKDKRAAIIGYLKYDPSGRIYKKNNQTVYVYPTNELLGSFIASVQVPYHKDGKNSVSIEEDGSSSYIYDNEGKIISRDNKVMISFDVAESDEVYLEKIRFDVIQ